MADVKVIAYFMHEHERAAASAAVKNARVTDSYVMGEIDESNLPALEQAGLIVERVWPAATNPLEDFAPGFELKGVRATRRGEADIVTMGPPVFDPVHTQFYLLQLAGPLLSEFRERLAAAGVHPSERVGRGTYIAKITPQQLPAVQALDFVTGLTVYGAAETQMASSAFGAPMAAPAPASATPMAAFDVQLHDPADLAQTLTAVKQLNVIIGGAKGRKIRFYVLETDADATIAHIGAIPAVRKVERYIEPQLHNDIARQLLGIDGPPASPPTTQLTETGAGQIVAIADTGLDDVHPDFAGRIASLIALGRPGDTTDPHGHGTHVAGSVLGSGAASGGLHRGIAPGARLVFQSLLDASFKLGGLPLDLGDLFEEAYQNGARIHNNSWGAVVDSEYTMNSLEVDEFVAKRRDMLIVISAGNEGQAAQRIHAQLGNVDWLSIGAPGSCKNAITVGASRSSRTIGGFSTLTYGLAWPSAFPDAPIAADSVSGDPEAMAGFSSRGPCTDHRVKPDVVAPGTDILSAKSSRAPLFHFWGPGPSPEYAYMGGTSMAAPLVAGCAALIREYYVTTRGHAQPSAALLKATLINSARHLTGPSSIADFNILPNMHQGFGAVDMRQAYPNSTQPDLKLEFVDDWQNAAASFTVGGQRRRFKIGVAAGRRFAVCLVYTDAPGRALQNNLNLLVEAPGGSKIVGNQNLPLALSPLDQENNVEIVRIDAPAAGDYMIQVAASNLLSPSQDFALVVTGALTSALTAV